MPVAPAIMNAATPSAPGRRLVRIRASLTATANPPILIRLVITSAVPRLADWRCPFCNGDPIHVFRSRVSGARLPTSWSRMRFVECAEGPPNSSSFAVRHTRHFWYSAQQMATSPVLGLTAGCMLPMMRHSTSSGFAERTGCRSCPAGHLMRGAIFLEGSGPGPPGQGDTEEVKRGRED